MSNEQDVRFVNIGLVERPDPPVRDHFDEQELARLAQSIRENGILVPLLVRSRGDKFEVIDGDRRLAAAWSAGVREVPVMVRDLSDEQTHIQRMLANLDRHDPDPVSEAKYIALLVHNGTFTPEQFAEKLGRSIEWIEMRLRIAEMPPYMQIALSNKSIALGVCIELSEIRDKATMERYFSEAHRSGMTVHSAKINKLMVNEAIDALSSTGTQVSEQTLPDIQIVPRARCALTGKILLITEMRMVRVGIRDYEEWQRDLEKGGHLEVPS